MRLVAGIDIGSAMTKAVVMQADGTSPRVIGRGVVKTGVQLERAAHMALELATQQAGVRLIDVYIATTGFGRYAAPFRDIQITEITSAARGARFLVSATTTVLDIGSQSTRAIRLTEGGRVAQFKSNDKCAAGSGSFIVRAAKYLEVRVEDVGELALKAENPQPISSVCAVLAESEIINHVSAGVGVEDILRGIYDSLADRASLLLKRVGMGKELTFLGGVARQRGMVRALEERLGVSVHVPEGCDEVCAIGAALLGLKRLEARQPAPALR
ncbi:MAG TPA: acyl-CoA dehydratase activase [Terriglobales bacterium]|nr:acyl-CoA dehydratase activase [Terriglobales bacterium]